MTSFPDVSSITYLHVAGVKALVAFSAALLLMWWWRNEARGRRSRTLQRAALACLGVVALAGWWNFGRFHYGGGYVHVHEFFHYYINAKYFPELGYTGLYDCAVVVEARRGRGPALARHWIRDLTTNDLRVGSPALANPSICRDRFATTERWAEFTHDVGWILSNMNAQKRADIYTDHGYNGTPVWALAGGLLADTGPISRAKVLMLALIDPVLLCLTLALVWWAFGWQVLCVALIWLGTNYPARFNFTGGAFLRQDWLLLAIAAICFAKRGYMGISGFVLTWSALLRIFPAFMILGLAAKAALSLWRSPQAGLKREYWRFGIGAVAALVVLLPLSLTTGGNQHGGLSEWTGFLQNSRKLVDTPLTNHVGLPVLAAFSPSGRSENLSRNWMDAPWEAWKNERRRAFGQRYPIYVIVVIGFLVLLARAADRVDDWEALALGIGAIPFLTELTSYYFVILFGLALLWPRFPIAGIGLAVTALLTGLVPALVATDDDRYALISLVIVLYVVILTYSVSRSVIVARQSEAGTGLAPDPSTMSGHVASRRAVPRLSGGTL